MSNSTVTEWLNENSLRSYPLLEDSIRYVGACDIHGLVLDAALFYEEVPNQIKLETITTAGTTLTLNITGQSPFIVSNYTTTTYPKYIRNAEHSLLVIGEPKGLLANRSVVIGAEFEPCIALEVFKATKGVDSITIADQQLTGDVVLNDGYQLSLLPSKNVIAIEVGRNEGHPLPCISILETENDCGSIASFINGATPDKSGGKIKFVAGKHIKIYEDTDNNRIYIGYDFVTSDLHFANVPEGGAAIQVARAPGAWIEEGDSDIPSAPPQNFRSLNLYSGKNGTLFKWSVADQQWISIVS